MIHPFPYTAVMAGWFMLSASYEVICLYFSVASNTACSKSVILIKNNYNKETFKVLSLFDADEVATAP